MSTDNTLINEKVKVEKLIKDHQGEVSFQFVTIGENLKKEFEVDRNFINLELFLLNIHIT